MTAFALVHGAWHGSWCWQPLIPALEARGHRALAMDLSATDTAADAKRYRDAPAQGNYGLYTAAHQAQSG